MMVLIVAVVIVSTLAIALASTTGAESAAGLPQEGDAPGASPPLWLHQTPWL
jgi:hypothetical protein